MFDFDVSYLVITYSDQYGITVWGNNTSEYRSTVLFAFELTSSYSIVNWRDCYIPQSNSYQTYAKKQDTTIYWYSANSAQSDDGYQGFNVRGKSYKYIAFSV